MRPPLLTTTAFCLALSAQAAWALTPQEVAQSWAAWMDSYNVTYTQTMEGSDVVLTDVVGTPGRVRFHIPELRLAAEGEKVEVSIPRPATMQGINRVINGHIDLTGLRAVLFDTAHPAVDGPVDSRISGDVHVAITTENSQGTLELQGISVRMTGADNRGHLLVEAEVGHLRAASESLGKNTPFDGTGPLGAQDGFSLQQNNLSGTATITSWELFASGDPIAAIAQGADLRVAATHGPGESTTFHAVGSHIGSWMDGEYTAQFNGDGIGYKGTTNGVATASMATGVEGISTATIVRADTGFTFPLFAKPGLQKATMDINLTDLVVDATGDTLPPGAHAVLGSPIDVALNVFADVEVMADIWRGSKDVERTNPDTALRVDQMGITKMDLSAIWGRLEGHGTINMIGTSLVDGAPGTGKGSVRITGLEHVLDALASTGALDAPTRAMTEGMLRGLAKNGDTDPLHYDLELDGEGNASVNGKRF